MIRLSTFDFLAPGALPQALDALDPRHGDSTILAGGTNLVVAMKQGVSRPERVVWLGNVHELQQIEYTKQGGLRIGALCTLVRIERDPAVQCYLPSLPKVIRSIASPQIRNRATIGGNLCLNTRCSYFDQSAFWRGALGYCLKHGNGVCHAAPGLKRCSAVLSSDLAPLLIALNASVKVVSASTARNIPLKDFYADDGMHYLGLRAGELLAEVTIPAESMQCRIAFDKLRLRGSIDYPLANIATAAIIDADDVVRAIRIIVGAVLTTPIELHTAETLLLGKRLAREEIDRAAEVSMGHVKPLPTSVESVLYKKMMVKHLVQKSLHGIMLPVNAADAQT